MQVKKKPKKTAKAVPEKSRKKKQPSEDQIKKQPFLKRMLFGEEKPDLSELEAGSTTILDILSPTTVDTKSRDYIIVDDVYHAYLYITGYGYTTTVGTCWLAPLVEAGEGINLSFLVKRQPKEKILSKIAQTTMVNRSRMRDVGDTRQDYEELDSAISSGLYLKDVMNRQGENFYYMHTLIEVTASDPETLEQRVTEVEKLCVSNQQKYILEILKEFKYLRVRQLYALVQAHYRTQGIKIDERRMEIMLRQMRTGTNYVWLRGDVVSYGDRRIDPRLLEALDVMLELTKAQPGFYSKDGLHEPFLLRFTGNGKGAGYLFSVAWLDAATHIATVPRMKGERIIWISESGSFGEIDLPRHHFFAARQKDGTHRFFGSNEPEKI